MESRDGARVLEKLRELEGWTEYILEALVINRISEPVKGEMLKLAIGDPALRQLREMSWSLRDKLHVVATQIELSCAEPVWSKSLSSPIAVLDQRSVGSSPSPSPFQIWHRQITCSAPSGLRT